MLLLTDQAKKIDDKFDDLENSETVSDHPAVQTFSLHNAFSLLHP